MAAHGFAQDTQPADPETLTALGDNPRSMLTRFFALSRRGDYAAAAQFLELPPGADPARAPQLAKRLRLVLDHYVGLDLSKISTSVNGAQKDGFPAGVDEIARLPVEGSLTEPVRVVRRAGDARWRFSRVTVQRIDDWYADLPNRLWLDLMPEPLLRMGPHNMLWGQWASLPVFVLVIWLVGYALSRVSRRLLSPYLKATSRAWAEQLLLHAGSPLSSAFGLFTANLLLPLLGLYPAAQSFADRALRALLFATFFWAIACSVDVAAQWYASSRWGRGAPATRALLLFGSRVAKLIIAAFALVALFSELGYPVASLIAGLGVGGIAVALAAQKSLENLLGAFAIAVDQPFREGDFVRVDNLLGTVELIGMRSTRIRTPDRTLVSIPNGKLAEMRIETFAARDRVRLSFTFGLTYATGEAQLRSVLQQFETLLREHPKIWPEGCNVRFIGLGESSLQVEAGCWFATANFDEFADIRQEVLLRLMKIVEDSGAAFAFPTRTLVFAPGHGVERASAQPPPYSLTVQRGPA